MQGRVITHGQQLGEWKETGGAGIQESERQDQYRNTPKETDRENQELRLGHDRGCDKQFCT